MAADLAGFLETAHSKIHPGEATGRTDGLSNVELTVLSEVDNSLARSDQKSGRVRANGTKLQKAAHNAALRWSELSRERDHPGWQLRRLEQPPSRFAQPRPIPESAVAAPAQRELFDHNQWMSPQWVLFTFETIFVLAEGFFWYQAFSQAAEPGLNLGQFAAVLLALLVPAAALYVSYGAAKLLHRRIRRHGASDRLTTIGIGAWLALFLAILIAIMVLVNWRFTPGAGLEFGGVEIPPQPMAIAFGAVLACDLLARTFLVSEIRTQYEKRRRNFRKLARKYLKAARKHHVAWARLSNAVQSNLDQSRRIETAGARLLSHAEAFFGDAYKINSLPPKVGALRAHDRAAQAGLDEVARVSPQDDAGRDLPVPDDDPLVLPNTESLRLIHRTDLLAPQGILATAIHLLTSCRARSPERARARVDDLWQELHAEPQVAAAQTGSKTLQQPIETGGNSADTLVSPR
ncbi:hypothetical protein [Nocardia beijingensis]|uniref:hypothetical protein n=1 Tax=Nocardia beijingensis TaxID=95162 RepID=UPI0033BA17BB